MARITRKPIVIPSDITVTVSDNIITAKGSKVAFTQKVPNEVSVTIEENTVRFAPIENLENANALSGTACALFMNMLEGLKKPFERKLLLVGVGYRAQLQGKKLSLALGFAHGIEFQVPEEIQIELPSQTEIMIKGVDKQSVGQVAAKIRAFRPPEPYKGKGVRYADEQIILKEGKKK